MYNAGLMEIIILLILAAAVRIPFILQAGSTFDLDEATFALMSRHILQGEFSFYIFGHSYSGSLISYLIAPFIAVFGNTVLSVKLATTGLFLGFLTVNYFLFRRIASRAVAVFTTLFLVLMPMDMFDISMRAWGGHMELWIFQAAALLLLAKYFDGPTSFFAGRLLFFTGLVIGCALWLSEFFVLFLMPFLFYFFLRFRQPQDDNIFKWALNFFLLKYFRLPKWLRLPLIALNCFLLFVILVHVAGLFLLHQPGIPDKFFKIFGAIPPFQIKMLKKLLLVFGIEVIGIYFMHSLAFSKLLMIRNLGGFIGGFLVGYLPAFIFNIAGGEGLRIFQKSGSLSAAEIPNRFQSVFTQKIPNFILGIGDNWVWRKNEWLTWGSWGFFAVILSAIVFSVLYFRKDIWTFIKPINRPKPSYFWVYIFIAIFTIKANLFSTLEAARYLAPLYLSIAAILGYFFGQVLWNKLKPISILLALLTLSYLGYDLYRYYDYLPKERAKEHYEIIDYVKSRNVRGGFAARSLSHILNYYSGEEVIFSTYLRPPERYIPHEKYAITLTKRAFVFEPGDSAQEEFKNDTNLFSKVKSEKKIGGTAVYIVEEETVKDHPAYTPPASKFPVHFYLNE